MTIEEQSSLDQKRFLKRAGDFVLSFYVCTDIITIARGYKYLNFPSSSYNFGIKWDGKKFGGEE
jgi:hypothetical protein